MLFYPLSLQKYLLKLEISSKGKIKGCFADSLFIVVIG
jgi:hypothetical protein